MNLQLKFISNQLTDGISKFGNHFAGPRDGVSFAGIKEDRSVRIAEIVEGEGAMAERI